MKKFIFLISLAGFVLCLHSCTKTCVCVNENNEVQEIEIDPAESCSDRSSPTLGICS